MVSTLASSFFAISILFVVQLANAQSEPLAPPGSVQPADDNGVIHKRALDRDSLDTDFRLILDRTEDLTRRFLALDRIYANRFLFQKEDSVRALAAAQLIRADPTQPTLLRTKAVQSTAGMIALLWKQGATDIVQREAEITWLKQTALDRAEVAEVRGAAIRGFRQLRASDAIVSLIPLFNDPDSRDVPAIAGNLCLAVADLLAERGIPTLQGVLAQTNDASVFGAAAVALSWIPSPESMAALVQAESRFPESGSVDAALAELPRVIIDVLRDRQNPHLTEAVQATRHLWKDGQQEEYIPLLLGIVRTEVTCPQFMYQSL